MKKRSRALPLSPWLGHEQEGGVGQMQGQEQGKKAYGDMKWNGSVFTDSRGVINTVRLHSEFLCQNRRPSLSSCILVFVSRLIIQNA
jgi:hypothetical protein